MGLMTPDVQRYTPEQAAQLGFRFDPKKGYWVKLDGSRPSVFSGLNNDPNWFKTSDIGIKQVAAGLGLFVGAPLAASALAPAAAASAAPGSLPVNAIPTSSLLSSAPSAALSAPGVAGPSILSRVGQYAQHLAPILGQAAEGSAAGQQDASLNAYREGQLDLDRKRFDEQSEASRYRRALVSNLLGSVQDVNVSVPGLKPVGVSGGLRPSAINADGRAMLSEMSGRAMDQIRQGNPYPAGPGSLPTGGNKGVNWAATIASLLGGLKAKPAAPPVTR